MGNSGKKKKGIIWGIIIGVVVLAAAVAICIIFFFPKSVETVPVENGSVSQSVSEVGNVAADDAIIIYSPVSGKISEVNAKENEYIDSDKTLVKYELKSFEDSVEEAGLNTKYYQDGYDAAVSKNNEYRQMLNTATAEEEQNKFNYMNLSDTRDNILVNQEGREQDIGNSLKILNANLESLSAQLQAAQVRLESIDPSDEEAVKKAKAEIDSLEKQIKDNRSAVVGMNANSLSAEEYKIYLAIVRELDFIEHFWSQNIEKIMVAKQALLPQSQLDQYQDSVEIAKLEELRAERNLEIAKRGVPMEVSGTILERFVDAGATVEAGEPLFSIQPDHGYKANVMISKYDIGYIEEGQSATITVGNTSYEGVVESISPVAENDASGKPKVKVTVAFSDSEAKPVIGLEAEIQILVGQADNVTMVSSKGVYTDDEGDYVYVLNGGVIERRNITAGLKGSDKTEITDGLKAGDQVVLTPVTEDEIGSRRRAK